MKNLHFTALDFETANSSRCSICQVGICRVVNGEVVFADSFLVQPPNNEYSSINSCIHGISAADTLDMPLFPEVWEKIKYHIEDELVVAHNAVFDVDCLFKTLDYYNIERPLFRTDCTYRISRLNLKDLAESLEINLPHHHNALFDARVCSEAYIKLKSGCKPDLSKVTKKVSKSVYEGHEQLCGKILIPDLENSDVDSPFYGKKVIFTGVLDNYSRGDAAKIVQKMGADIDTSISKKTDFVIIGKGAGPSKLKKIAELNGSGSSLKLLYEDEFSELISKYHE